ncbi:glutathione S-transferase 1: isoform C-like protein, partial [Dinothrombium tinctorium]
LFNYIRYQYISDEDLKQHVYKLVDQSCIVYSFRKKFSQRKIPETSIDAFAGKNQVDKIIEKQEMKVNLCCYQMRELFFCGSKLILNVATDLSFPFIDVRVDEIDLSDFSFQAFQMVIDYVYTGFINLSGQNKYDLYELYRLARNVRVEELLDAVDEQIRKIEIEPFNKLNERIEELCKKIEKIEEKVNTLVELNPAPIRTIRFVCSCEPTWRRCNDDWREDVSHYKCSKIFRIEFEFYEALEESQVDFNIIAENVQEESLYIYAGIQNGASLTTRYLNIPLELIEVDLLRREQMREEFLAINPRHCVPTIDDDGFILWE